MFKHLSLIGIALFLSLAPLVQAKEKKVKFGKIDDTWFQVEQCPIDSNAHAFYIFDKGYSYFQYSDGFKLVYKRHFRIKILDETALDEASFELSLYKGSGSNEESVGGLKAITYNLEDGTIVSTKMDKKSIIREHKSEYWDNVKFALPNVKKGSVIEVQYEIASDFWNHLSGWYFQYDIPVLKSNYRVEIPEYYIYKQFQHGYVSYDTQRSGGRGTISFSTGVLDYSTEIFDYSATNVPAFPIGEHLTTVDNYISHVEFELATIDMPGQLKEYYTTTWTSINERLLDSQSFGLRLEKNRCYQDCAESINALHDSENEKMNAAFAYIKAHTKWNDYYGLYTSQSLSKTLETGVGNVADVNLSLVALLRRIGLQADPVVLSTRSNGFLHTYRPSKNKLNYVIASCTIDDEVYLMDATNDWSGVDMIPTRCLNGSGLLVNVYGEVWLPLSSGAKYQTSNSYSLTLSEDGLFSGYIIKHYLEYASYLERNNVKDYESVEKYIEDIEEDNDGLTIVEYKITNVDSLHKSVSGKLQVEIADNVEIMGDLMVFSPIFYDAMERNPLKLETREYPVEYLFPSKRTLRATVRIPENYEVESLPEGFVYKSESGSCIFKYMLQESMGTISVLSHYERSQIIYPYTQYSELKEFYETIVKKHNEKIVLKKKAVVTAETSIPTPHE